MLVPSPPVICVGVGSQPKSSAIVFIFALGFDMILDYFSVTLQLKGKGIVL